MQLKKYLRYFAIGCLAILPVIAAEYRGQVKFSGMPLPGATVTATQGDKKVTAISDPAGNYYFPDLADGTWQFEADMLGFDNVKQDGTPGSGLPGPTFNLRMLSLDKIDAVAAPPAPAASPDAATAPAQTTSATPPPPAATPAKPATGKNGVPVAGPATAFQRTGLNAQAGAANTPAEPPAPEVTSELSQRAADGLLVNGSAQNGASSPFAQSPAFGNNRKSGPRLYTYGITLVDSNSALNAANYSLNGQQTIKPPTNTLTGGINFGGPIKIPHLLTRNGPQITVNYSRTQNRNSNVSTALMPDPLERAGNFSQTGIQIFDPLTNQPFANNTIPVSRLSPQALSLLNLYVLPNSTGAYNYQVPLISNTHADSVQVRINKSFKRKNFVSGSFAMRDTRSDNTNDFNFLDLTRQLGMQSTASYRRTFTPRFYGTVTYQFSRQSTQLFPFFSGVTNISGAAGISGNDQTPLNWGPPSLGFQQSGIDGLRDQQASIRHDQTSLYSYVGTWNHGRHNIQFGGDFAFQQTNLISQSNPRGGFSFNRAATQQYTTVNGVSTPVANTGFDFADFLLGVPDQSQIAFGNADKYYRSVKPDLFFQDDWKVTPGFSVTLAMRWEYSSPVTELYGRLVNLDVAPGYKAIAPVLGSSPKGSLTGLTYPSSLINPDKHEFLPKPGIAWRPFPASSMVIRAGYGLGYNTGIYNSFANQMSQQAPISKSLSVLNSTATPLTLANGFTLPPNVISNTFAVDPNFKIGYAQVWNVSVQRDLPGSLVMLATYTGTRGTHQLQAFVPNTYPSGAANPCPTCPSGFTYYTSGGNSTRQGASLNLRRRLHNGFTASLLYTYSKSIDDAATLGGGGLGSAAQNWLNLKGERGPSSFDQRHLANLSLQYTSGMGIGGGALMTGWRGKLIKDWTFVDNINIGTGLPLTPNYPVFIGSIQGATRASYTGASLYDAPAGRYLNPLALSAPGPGQWGNAGVGSIRGPGQFSMNASMQRAFRLNDRFNLSLQINADNPLNHVVFGSWQTSIASLQQFGLPVNPNPMRSVTTQLRLTF